MNSPIEIFLAGARYETTSLTFSGGELHVEIPGLPDRLTGDMTVLARVQSSEALIRLVLATEILFRTHRSGRRRLVLPYMPYARQDRVTQSDGAFSLQAVAGIINGLGFDEVVVFDPHSDVTPALIEHVRVIHQRGLVATHKALIDLIETARPTIVSPDAGAEKKAFVVAQEHKLPLITATKVRDPATGKISGTQVHSTGPLGDVLIVDDICDGGRTFIELAKVLRSQGAGRVFLYVTHGIFSKGLGVFEGLIDAIYTTDSFLSPYVEHPELSPVPLHVSPIASHFSHA